MITGLTGLSVAASLVCACAAGPGASVHDSGVAEDVVEPFVISDAPEDLGPGIDVVTFVDDAPVVPRDTTLPAMDGGTIDASSPHDVPTDVSTDSATADTGMPAVDPCATSTDCGTCTGAAGCGWCGASGRCMTGAVSGPTGDSCAASWAWTTNDCSALPGDSCGSSTTCLTCTLGSSCGWCADSSTCHSGSSTNPDDHACAGSAWNFRELDCL